MNLVAKLELVTYIYKINTEWIPMTLKNIFILIFLLGNFTNNYSQNEVFTINELIGKTTPKNSNNNYKLRKEVYDSFLLMQKAALKDGIKIKIVSAYRSYNRQQNIWNRKFKQFKSNGMSTEDAVNKILEYSTIPGTSRHHWGTDIDIIMETKTPVSKLLLTSNYNVNGPFNKLKKWMDKNAKDYCFELVYTNDPKRTGFNYEPWHYTFYPTSEKILKAFISKKAISYIDLQKIEGNKILTLDKLHNYLKNNIIIK